MDQIHPRDSTADMGRFARLRQGGEMFKIREPFDEINVSEFLLCRRCERNGNDKCSKQNQLINFAIPFFG